MFDPVSAAPLPTPSRIRPKRGPHVVTMVPALVLALLSLGVPALARAQKPGSPDGSGLDSGSSGNAAPPQGSHAAAPGTPEATGTATVSGTVLDTGGAEIQGARVVLKGVQSPFQQVLQSASNGEFTFTDLAAGAYKLSVGGKGWGTYTSPVIRLKPGDFHLVTGVVLPPLAASATVRVYANPVQLSEQQVQIAVHQRVLGVIPNFYSSYDRHAPPMRSPQKYQLAFRSAIDPLEFVSTAGIAGVEQYYNNFPEFGGGIAGYGKRYAAAYATTFTSRMISDAILPSVFHQDPRYFYRGTGTTGSRALYAIDAAFIARSDSGRWGPNYSRLIGSFASAGLSELYYPASDRGFTLIMANGLVNIGDDAATNLLREFVLKRLMSRKPVESSGKP